jgi:hypothetical protein
MAGAHGACLTDLPCCPGARLQLRYPVAPGTLYGTAQPGTCNEANFNADMTSGGLGMEGGPPSAGCLPSSLVALALAAPSCHRRPAGCVASGPLARWLCRQWCAQARQGQTHAHTLLLGACLAQASTCTSM